MRQLIVYNLNNDYNNKKMVKVYYSYSFEQAVGLVCSRQCNFAINHQKKIIVAGTSQYIAILSLKTGEIIKYLFKSNKNVPIRFIKLTNNKIYAAYQDGEITAWDIQSYQFLFSLDMHKSTVSSISFFEEQMKIVSGGLDGHIIIWDTLSEQHQIIKSAHGNAITQLQCQSIIYQGKLTDIIISIAKDGFLKVWDAKTKLCLSVISTQTTQALSLAYSPQRRIIYVGTNKEDLVLIKLNEHSNTNICELVGIFKRKNYTKCIQIQIQYNKMFILTDKKLQIYEFLSQQKLKQKKKRLISRKKGNQQIPSLEQYSINEYQMHISPLEEKPLLLKAYNFYILQSKIYINDGSNIVLFDENKSITHSNGKTQQLQIQYPFLIQRNNVNIQVYNYGNFNHLFSIPQKALSCSLFNSGFLMIIQSDSVTLWDLAKNQVIYKLQQSWLGCWVRKNKCLLWRQNELGIFEIGTTNKGKVQMKQLTSKFFQDKINFAMYRHSFDKYAVNLQNSQININFADTNKNCLKLYGHKLPINSFDISSDDSLLVSGSVDKDIRIWDLDFGHCIKSIFAHSEAVTTVKFIKQTHYILSGSKDGHIKFWDGDTHQLIIDLQQTLLEIKSLAVTSAGDYIIGGGLDGGFRIWKQSNDQTIAGDQDEKNMQKMMIEEYAVEKFKEKDIKTRYQDLKHGQEIIQALQNNEQPMFLLKLIQKISPSNLKSSLSFLHNSHVLKLEQYLRFLIKQKHQTQTCWRIIEALGRHNTLGPQMRKNWQQISKILRINKESLKILLKTLKDQKQFTI